MEAIVHPLALAHAADEVAERAGWTRAQLDAWAASTNYDERNALIAALGDDRELVITFRDIEEFKAKWETATGLCSHCGHGGDAGMELESMSVSGQTFRPCTQHRKLTDRELRARPFEVVDVL